jgi:hypothetical protein
MMMHGTMNVKIFGTSKCNQLLKPKEFAGFIADVCTVQALNSPCL